MKTAVSHVRYLVVLAFFIFIFVAPACAPYSNDCAHENAFCVGLVTAYDSVDNDGLNQATWEALTHVQEGTHVEYIESIDKRDWGKNIAFFANRNYDVVVTVGYDLGDPTVAAAIEYPQITFIGVDQQIEEAYPNIVTIIFAEEQAGFLAGALAAMVTTTDKVGAVCESSGIPSVWRYCEGFRAGVEYVDEELKSFIVYRDDGSSDKTFNDPEWGRQTALNLIDSGVDIIFAYGGGTAEGAYLEADEQGILIIGTEEIMSYPQPDFQNTIISYIIKDPKEQLLFLLQTLSQGSTPTGRYPGQITYTPIQNFTNSLDEIRTRYDIIYKNLLKEKIKVDLPEVK